MNRVILSQQISKKIKIVSWILSIFIVIRHASTVVFDKNLMIYHPGGGC